MRAGHEIVDLLAEDNACLDPLLDRLIRFEDSICSLDRLDLRPSPLPEIARHERAKS